MNSKILALVYLVTGVLVNCKGDQDNFPTELFTGNSSQTQVPEYIAASELATQALWTAAMNNDPTTARDAIENGADINRAQGNGYTPLHIAAKRDHFGIVGILLRAGANKEILDKIHDRPIHLAAGYGRDASMTLLAVAGADLHVTGDYGETPLEKALKNSHNTTAFLLRALGGWR